jgi:hypothetical protein
MALCLIHAPLNQAQGGKGNSLLGVNRLFLMTVRLSDSMLDIRPSIISNFVESTGIEFDVSSFLWILGKNSFTDEETSSLFSKYAEFA